MKRTILVFFLSCTMIMQAQEWGLPSGHNYHSIEVGSTTFRPYQLNDFLFGNSSGNTFNPMITFGYGNGGTILIGRGGTLDASIALNFYYPQEVIVKPDTLKYRAGGWELMTSIYGFDLLASVKAIDVVVAPGVFWGSIHLRKYNSTGNFRSHELFKNPFVAPMIRGDLRLVLGRFALGGRFSYRYDITKSKWKKGSGVLLPGYKCEELQYMVYVGLTVNTKIN